jgi:DNA-binding HxlR family transcriptional regulator
LSGDVDRLFEAISHRVRRSIIESIAEKGPRSFTELMEDTGVGDTGTLTFHLRKMAGFIRKNERGDYELTDLGRRAYELIKIAYGGVEPRREEPGARAVEAPRSSESLEPDIVYISDSIKVTIDRSLLETVKAQGKRLVVRDVISVDVTDDVDAKLFSEVVESIRGVIRLRVPEHLRSIATLKSRDVLGITTGRSHLGLIPDMGGLVAGIVEPVVSTVSSILESLSTTGPLSKVEEAKSLLYEWRFPSITGLSLDLSGGFAKVRSVESGEALIRIEGREGRCSYDVDVEDDIIEVDLSGCEASIELPRRPLELLEIDMSGGALNIDLGDNVRRIEGSLSGGLAELKVARAGETRVDLDASGGRFKVHLDYVEFQGVSEVKLSLTGGLMELSATAPEGVRVEVSTVRMGGLASVTVDEKLRNVEKAKALVKARIEVTGGLARVEFSSRRA